MGGVGEGTRRLELDFRVELGGAEVVCRLLFLEATLKQHSQVVVRVWAFVSPSSSFL